MPRRVKRPPGEPPPHRVEELATAWGVSDDSIRDGLRSGRIRGFRLNRIWLIPHAEKLRIEQGETAA
jgi:hypothetical protein